MAKTKINWTDKKDNDLLEMVVEGRETIRAEGFKTVDSRKASVIRKAKLEIAQALTELGKRRNVSAK